LTAFLIADAVPHDMDAYRASGYLEAAVETAANYGGKYRARGGELEELEGEWNIRRLVIIEFPSMDDLKAFYTSPEYQKWIPVRQSLTDSKVLAVDGID
jgi:uncharacterized protein (DUF1330 family)